jgi:hypothetical protein
MEAALRSEKRVREAERKDAAEKRSRDGERKESVENLSRNSVSDFATRSDERPVKKFKGSERKENAENLTCNFMPDSSPRSEEWFSRKPKESDMQEALENLCKTSAEFLARSAEEKFGKRTREAAESLVKSSSGSIPPSDERPPKRTRETEWKEVTEDKSNCMALVTDPSVDCAAVDIEALLTSSTVSKDGATVSVVTPSEEPVTPLENSVSPPVATEKNSVIMSEPIEDKSLTTEGSETESPQQPTLPTQVTPSLPPSLSPQSASLPQSSSSPIPVMLPEVPEPEPEPESSSVGGRATRSGAGRRVRSTKRSKQAVTNLEEPEAPVVERKVLRSSAGRAAAAAAARAAAAAKAEEERENSENTKDSKKQESVDANCEASPSEQKVET